jgi:alpha-glucoside transport system substrate-binding protein
MSTGSGWVSRFLTSRARRQRAAAVVMTTILATACGGSAADLGSGAVRVLGAWEGPELAAFRAMVAPFEQRTGIRIDYTGTRDLEGVLARAVKAGDPPDVAGLAGPAHMRALARDGVLRDLAEAIDPGSYKRETAPAFVDLGTVDNRLVGVFIRSTVKGLLWFNPEVFQHGRATTWAELQQLAMRPKGEALRPWCLGLESGAASGWPGTDWIEDFLLRQSGPTVYDAWVGGSLPWSSPEVRAAFAAYGQVAAEGNLAGGVRGATTTHFAVAGRPLFAEPPGCLFLHGGSFMAAMFADAGGGISPTVDFLPFPDIDPAFSGSVVGAGDLFGLVTDKPEARELMRYLVTAEAQQIWVDQGGSLSGNTGVTRYPDRISERAARLLREARAFRFDASDSMAPAMAAAFREGVMDFTKDQTRLDEVLAHLDAIRLAGTAP